jgi:hypothetical protein
MRRLMLVAAFASLSIPAWAQFKTDPDNTLQVNVTKSAPGIYVNGSIALGTTRTQIFAAAAATPRLRLHLLNTTYATSTGTPIAIWCVYGATVPAPHGVGSFPLYPGGGIDDANPSPVSQAAVSCVAEAAGATLYAEQF